MVEQTQPKGAYRETRTSELRRYKEPVDPAPYWHMPRFTRYVRPPFHHYYTYCPGP